MARIAPQPEPASPESVQVTSGGRVVLPARIREALGLSEGDSLAVSLTPEGAVLLTPRRAALARARALVRTHVKPSKRLASEELIAERRAEAQR